MPRPNLLGISVFLAANRDYYASVSAIKQVGSAILATVLWPLLLLGIDHHIR